MGIYLGQLPPAEMARFKAELAETVIANFCYPRFFDYRTGTLQTRPVDRTKRQEVWLYLSSVDFTAWSRIDLTSIDFQHRIERLFIIFVQRNRSFFGGQGRRRVADIRLSISACAALVAQRLRNHLTNQQQVVPSFGSPRPVITWSTTVISGRVEPTWEQIMPSTMELQRRLQEWRREIPIAPTPVVEPAQSVVPSTNNGMPLRQATQGGAPLGGNSLNMQSCQPVRSLITPSASVSQPLIPAAGAGSLSITAQQRAMSNPPPSAQPSRVLNRPHTDHVVTEAAHTPVVPEVSKTSPANQAGQVPAYPPVAPRRPSDKLNQSSEQNTVAHQSSTGTPPRARISIPTTSVGTPPPAESIKQVETPRIRSADLSEIIGAQQARVVSPAPVGMIAGSIASNTANARATSTTSDEDVAIFEQLRHQLLLWLRIEAVIAGLDISEQGPMQLLELLRQQSDLDETRLQVISTLLNLTNQVIKTGTASVLDYKQALTFHLIHTRRA